MGCGTSRAIHPPQKLDQSQSSSTVRSLARKASTVNRRSFARTKSMKLRANKTLATLGGESFYLMETCFKQIPGVVMVKPGHCPYKGVEIETVQISFDANKLSYENLIKAHF